MYPKVKVRDYAFDDDHFMNDRARSSLLEDFQSLSIHAASLQDGKQKAISSTSVARIPKSYVPNVRRPASAPKVRSSPRVAEENNKNNRLLVEDRPTIRVSSIMRPRAVVSSPDNDAMIGSKNWALQERHSASGHTAVHQNRHKSQSHISGRRSSKDDADCSNELSRKNVSALTVSSQRRSFLTDRTKHHIIEKTSSRINRDF